MIRRGVTLLELVVVVAIIGIMATVSALAFRAPADGNIASTRALIARARGEAIRSRAPIVVLVDDSLGLRAISAMPDGSIVGTLGLDSARLVERLAGRPAAKAIDGQH